MGIGGLGFGELVLIFAVLLLLFGAKRLPELASGMGKGIRDFRRSLNGLDEQALKASQTPQSLAANQPPAAPQIQATAEAEPKRQDD